MRGSQRLIAMSVLIALSGALGGCSGALSSFDPSDMLDWLDTKKKLPGDRKAVFPEGVPGLEQGVPKDLYKGSRQEQIDQRRQPQPQRQPPHPLRRRPPGRLNRRRARRLRLRRQRPSRSRPQRLRHSPLPRLNRMPRRPRKKAMSPPRLPRRSRPRSSAAVPPRHHLIRRRSSTGPAGASPAEFRVPCADAERQFLALVFSVALTGAANPPLEIIHVHDRHRRPAQRRQVDAVQPPGRTDAGARRRPARRHPRPARGRGAGSAISTSPSSTPPGSRRRRRGLADGRMQAQTEAAIAQADALLFVIDARTGPDAATTAPSPISRGAPASRSCSSPTRPRASTARSARWKPMRSASAIRCDLGRARRGPGRSLRRAARPMPEPARGRRADDEDIRRSERRNAPDPRRRRRPAERRQVHAGQPAARRGAAADRPRGRHHPRLHRGRARLEGTAIPPVRHRRPAAAAAHRGEAREAFGRRRAPRASASPRSWCC